MSKTIKNVFMFILVCFSFGIMLIVSPILYIVTCIMIVFGFVKTNRELDKLTAKTKQLNDDTECVLNDIDAFIKECVKRKI